MSDELAKRAVACKSWRWMPGMLSSKGRIASVDTTLVKWISVYDEDAGEIESFYDGGPNHALPDLTDPATIGCLLHLVRQHWGDGGAHTKRFCRYGGGEKWLCYAPSVFYPTLQTDGESEAEALVKALEMEIPND